MRGLFLPCFAIIQRGGGRKAGQQDLVTVGSMPRIQNFVKTSLLAAVFGLALAQAAPAEENKVDKVVAIVNGYEIKTSEVAMAADDVIGQLPNVPPKLRYPFLVDYLVERHLLAQLAVKEGVAETDEYKRRLALYQAKALRDAYLFQKIRPEVTEEEIKAAYDEEAAKLAQTERVRARHILVGSEKEATDILARIEKGEKFEDLAKQYSLDGSKDYGGDLGYFTAPEMVPEFSKAAFALKTGETSQPVKTDFGWHIIRLEDRKMGAAQPYDQVKPAIRSVLLGKKLQQVIAELRSASKIEFIDEDLKKRAEETAAQRKALEEKKATEGDSESTGKGDLLIPQQ
jgi:peptidyl-prolyl cis-trans isomerase C